MEIAVGTLPLGASGLEAEVVEHKGTGHPDTICDALAEAFGVGLARFYLGRFGEPQHFNVDKALLVGGVARPAFGGGEVLAPIRIFLAGRATTEVRGVHVPVEDIAEATARAWLREHVHALDAARHVSVTSLVHAGSSELVELFRAEHAKTGSHHLSNDTSIGAGYAPLSRLENAVKAAAERLGQLARARADVGEDVKVMGIRHGGRIHLVVACATIDAHVPNAEAYLETRREIAREVGAAARGAVGHEVSVDVNGADNVEASRFYLTVTGTSAESGDDGQVGRGNRANGLITPYRPMTLEALSGKNPYSHAGKLYGIVAQQIAEHLVGEVDGIEEAHCVLVSRIGRRVDDPVLVDLRLRTADGAPSPTERQRAREIARRDLSGIESIADELVRGHAPIS